MRNTQRKQRSYLNQSDFKGTMDKKRSKELIFTIHINKVRLIFLRDLTFVTEEDETLFINV